MAEEQPKQWSSHPAINQLLQNFIDAHRNDKMTADAIVDTVTGAIVAGGKLGKLAKTPKIVFVADHKELMKRGLHKSADAVADVATNKVSFPANLSSKPVTDLLGVPEVVIPMPKGSHVAVAAGGSVILDLRKFARDLTAAMSAALADPHGMKFFEVPVTSAIERNAGFAPNFADDFTDRLRVASMTDAAKTLNSYRALPMEKQSAVHDLMVTLLDERATDEERVKAARKMSVFLSGKTG